MTTQENNATTSPDQSDGMGWRVTVSVLAVFGFLIATVLWIFFFAGDFDAYQNFAVLTVTVLAFIAAMGATWASWGMRHSTGVPRTRAA